MTLTKKLLVLFLCTATSSLLPAQTSVQPNEIGVRFGGLQDFDLIYKKAKKDDRYQRIRAGFGNLNFQNSEGSQQISFAAAIAFGVEKRREIGRQLLFLHGWEPFLGLDFQSIFSQKNRSSLTLNPGLGYVLGLQVNFSERVSAGIETLPSLSTRFNFSRDGFSDNYSIGAGFSMNDIALTTIYRL